MVDQGRLFSFAGKVIRNIVRSWFLAGAGSVQEL